MKTKLGILGACALGAILGFYGLGRPATAGQAGGNGQAVVARTRVAVLNLQDVMKKYPKYEALQKELKGKDEAYVNKLKSLEAQIKGMEEKYKNPQTPQNERDDIQKQVMLLRLQMENTTNDAKRELIKFHDESMVRIYYEVNQVVTEYCQTNGIDMVFRFNEDWDEKNYGKTDYVIRRLSMPFWPMYFDPNLNITFRVSDILNRKLQAAGGAPGGVVPAGNNQQP